MITQAELRAHQGADREAERLARVPEVVLADDARRRSKGSLDSIRQRVREGESVEAGRLRLEIKRTLATAWEQVVDALLATKIGAALITHRETAGIIRRAQTRDERASFVSARLTVRVVASEVEDAAAS
jgi:hypothetical protein